MPNKWKIALVALSVGLNVGFLAVWAVNRQAGSFSPDDDWSRDPLREMYRTVGVSDDQLQYVAPRLERLQRNSAELVNQMTRLHDELLLLAGAIEPDRGAINAKRDQILEIQGRLYDLAIERFLADREALNEQQRQKLWREIRERTSRSEPSAAERDSKGGNAASDPLVGLAGN